jgi:hypothetical protein
VIRDATVDGDHSVENILTTTVVVQASNDSALQKMVAYKYDAEGTEVECYRYH